MKCGKKILAMRLAVAAVGAVGTAAPLAAPAHADENPFAYSYTADLEERGETEVELWATDRSGKAQGRYDARDYRLELEHGFSGRFSASAYVNFASHHISGLEPEFANEHREFGFQGLSAEFKYKLLDDDSNGIGLVLYAEPGWSRIRDVEGDHGTEYELELKAIVSKGFEHDRIVWAGNLTFEPEWERAPGSGGPLAAPESWDKELKLQVSTGLAYRLAPRVYAGVEARYASVFPNWTSGLHSEASAIFAGPSVSYSVEKWSATLAFLPQLAGSPSASGGGRSVGEFEKREIRLRISHEL